MILGLLLGLSAIGDGAWAASSVTYAYDALGRLIEVAYSNGTVITYSYDAAGNRTTYVVTGAPG